MNTQSKTKRKRIRISFTDNVDKKIREAKKQLGFDKFTDKWHQICNEVANLQLTH